MQSEILTTSYYGNDTQKKPKSFTVTKITEEELMLRTEIDQLKASVVALQEQVTAMLKVQQTQSATILSMQKKLGAPSAPTDKAPADPTLAEARTLAGEAKQVWSELRPFLTNIERLQLAVNKILERAHA